MIIIAVKIPASYNYSAFGRHSLPPLLHTPVTSSDCENTAEQLYYGKLIANGSQRIQAARELRLKKWERVKKGGRGEERQREKKKKRKEKKETFPEYDLG